MLNQSLKKKVSRHASRTADSILRATGRRKKSSGWKTAAMLGAAVVPVLGGLWAGKRLLDASTTPRDS